MFSVFLSSYRNTAHVFYFLNSIPLSVVMMISVVLLCVNEKKSEGPHDYAFKVNGIAVGYVVV